MGCSPAGQAGRMDPYVAAVRDLLPDNPDCRLSQDQKPQIALRIRLDLLTSFGNNAPV